MSRAAPVLVLSLLLAATALSGCTRSAEAPETTTTPSDGPTPATPAESTTPGSDPPAPEHALYGVTLAPRNESNESAFLLEARAAGDVIAWVGDWDALGDANATPALLMAAAERQHFTPLVVASFFEADNAESASPLDNDTQARYQQHAVSFVAAHDVPYLALGHEVNRLDTAALDAFVAWWPDLYSAVKLASPETKVFPVFQYELLAGRQGGLLGGDPAAPAQWDLLEELKPRDVTAVTTYPGLVFAQPGDLPRDYYTQLDEHVIGALAIVSSGWFAEDFEGWGSSPREQDLFVERLLADGETIDAELVIWRHLFDQPDAGVYATMGLFAQDGQPRPAFHRWNDAVKESRD